MCKNLYIHFTLCGCHLLVQDYRCRCSSTQPKSRVYEKLAQCDYHHSWYRRRWRKKPSYSEYLSWVKMLRGSSPHEEESRKDDGGGAEEQKSKTMNRKRTIPSSSEDESAAVRTKRQRRDNSGSKDTADKHHKDGDAETSSDTVNALFERGSAASRRAERWSRAFEVRVLDSDQHSDEFALSDVVDAVVRFSRRPGDEGYSWSDECGEYGLLDVD